MRLYILTLSSALSLACLSQARAVPAAEDFNDSFSLERAAEAAVPVPSAPAQPAALQGVSSVKTVSADMSGFFLRLESVGLATGQLRALTSKVKVVFGGMPADAAATYGYMMNTLHLPPDFSEGGQPRVRFDLKPYEISTLLHEYVHAERDVLADKGAPKGTPAREHYDAVNAIQADLRSQSLFYRYSWMKADEVSAYFMGDAINTLFNGIDDLISYNTFFNGSKAPTVAEARRLGGLLLMPSAQAVSNGHWESMMLKAYSRFGQDPASDVAQFKQGLISGFTSVHWDERQSVKDDMYANILGLKPPKTLEELTSRLNKIDNKWIRGVREQVAQARMKNALKAEAEAAAHDKLQGFTISRP